MLHGEQCSTGSLSRQQCLKSRCIGACCLGCVGGRRRFGHVRASSHAIWFRKHRTEGSPWALHFSDGVLLKCVARRESRTRPNLTLTDIVVSPSEIIVRKNLDAPFIHGWLTLCSRYPHWVLGIPFALHSQHILMLIHGVMVTVWIHHHTSSTALHRHDSTRKRRFTPAENQPARHNYSLHPFNSARSWRCEPLEI